jgi:hypothetical protein
MPKYRVSFNPPLQYRCGSVLNLREQETTAASKEQAVQHIISTISAISTVWWLGVLTDRLVQFQPYQRGLLRQAVKSRMGKQVRVQEIKE